MIMRIIKVELKNIKAVYNIIQGVTYDYIDGQKIYKLSKIIWVKMV